VATRSQALTGHVSRIENGFSWVAKNMQTISLVLQIVATCRQECSKRLHRCGIAPARRFQDRLDRGKQFHGCCESSQPVGRAIQAVSSCCAAHARLRRDQSPHGSMHMDLSMIKICSALNSGPTARPLSETGFISLSRRRLALQSMTFIAPRLMWTGETMERRACVLGTDPTTMLHS